MAKCDTIANKKWLDADCEEPGIRCQECKVIHLKERCFEKITGWLCRSCAKKYDEELMKQMVAK